MGGQAVKIADRTTELVDWPTTMSDNQVLIRDSTAPTGYRFGDIAGMTPSGSETVFYPNATVIEAITTDNAWEIDTFDRAPSGGAEVVNAMSCATDTILDEFWLYDTVLSGTSIPMGPWQFDIYCSVSSVVGGRVSTIKQNIYLVDTGAGTVTITGAGTSRTATVTGGIPFVSGDASAFAANGSHRPLCSFLRTPNGIFPIIGFTSSSIVTIETLNTYVNEAGVAYTYWRKSFGIETSAITTIGTDYGLISTQYVISAAIPLTTTNKLGSAIFGVSNNTTTVNFVHDGSTHYSHIHTSFLQDISISIHNAVSKTTPVDADELGIWDSVSTVLNKVTFANLWAWINTKATAGITSIFKFMTYIWFPSAGLIEIHGDPATEAAERWYFDTYANMAGGLAATATYAAGVMTYTVAAGHGLSSGTTTDRVTVRGFNEADYNVTKSTYTYISATQFSVTTAGTPASPATGSGLSYALLLFENFYSFNVGVDTATGIWSGRDITNIVIMKGTQESGTEREYYHASAAAGTVPTWSNNYAKTINGAFAFAGRGLFSTGTVYPVAADTYFLGAPTLPYIGLYQSYTNTATVGNVTINKPCGRVNIGAGNTTMTLTNSTFTAATQGSAHLTAVDATAKNVYMTFAAGSATVTLDAACTAQVAIDFITNRT